MKSAKIKSNASGALPDMNAGAGASGRGDPPHAKTVDLKTDDMNRSAGESELGGKRPH
jgi:hypothetical protein